MKISFGIITEGNNDTALSRVIKSILDSEIPEKEIIVVGGSYILEDKVKFIPFDEKLKPGWITRKKNLIAMEATGEILVLLHDYIELDFGWNESLLIGLAKDNWNVAVCPIANLDGTRFRDWLIWPHNNKLLDKFFLKTRKCLLPYNFSLVTDLMYVSGAFLICKRDFFLANPLDESLVWGQGEDAEWSLRVRSTWDLKCFRECGVRLQKQKDVNFKEVDLIAMSLLLLHVMCSTFYRIWRMGMNRSMYNQY